MTGPDTSTGLPDPALRARVLARVREVPSPDRTTTRRTVRLVLLFACALTITIFFARGGIRVAPRPAWLVGATGAGAAVLAALTFTIGFLPGRSMLGRPTWARAAVVAAAPVALLLWKIAWSGVDPAMMVDWPERPGLRCLGLGLLLGTAPLLAMLAVRRRSELHHPVLAGACIGTTAGAFAWALTDLWCPVAYVPHLFLGHVLPLVCFVAVGAGAGSRWLGTRAG